MVTKANGPVASEERVASWLASSGLRFDPFRCLDAAADPYLAHYLVLHEALDRLWGAWHSAVFASLGAGKTALRARVTLQCYTGQEATFLPFPVPYVVPFLEWGHVAPRLDEHLAALSRAAAQQLLLSLAYRPHWFTRLGEVDRGAIALVLSLSLPGPLKWFTGRLRRTGDINALNSRFNSNFLVADPPDTASLLQLCDMLDRSLPPLEPQASPRDRWDEMVRVLLEVLHFRNVYVLLDGLDGAYETASDARQAAAVLEPLLPQLPAWAAGGIFFKGFLPASFQSYLHYAFPHPFNEIENIALDWTADLLVEVIRQRIYFASQGLFSSLNALASPGLAGVDIDRTLVQHTLALPREVIVLAEQLLAGHVAREDAEGLLDETDLDATLEWYHHNRPDIATADLAGGVLTPDQD